MRLGLGAGHDIVARQVVNAVFAAYEQCWTLVEGLLIGQPQDEINRVKQTIAAALVDAASKGHSDCSDLQQEAMRAVRVAHPDIPL